MPEFSRKQLEKSYCLDMSVCGRLPQTIKTRKRREHAFARDHLDRLFLHAPEAPSASESVRGKHGSDQEWTFTLQFSKLPVSDLLLLHKEARLCQDTALCLTPFAEAVKNPGLPENP